MVKHDREHEFYFVQGQDGKWRWTWLLPMRESALTVQSLFGCKTKAGAKRSAFVQTERLRKMMVALSRGDML